MKTTVLVAALLAAFSMPAFAEDAVDQTGDAKGMTLIDPATTVATTTNQSDMQKTAIKKHGCMQRNAAYQMM